MAEWIEIAGKRTCSLYIKSPLAMAEWIEIQSIKKAFFIAQVSASDGGVD